MKTYRWGILGAGAIVRRWIRGARQTPGLEIAAIGSRNPAHAAAAAAELGIPRASDYEGIVSDPSIDLCYIAVPHPFHRELAELAMNHGKHVLVEKPAAVTAADWEAMTACARKNGVFLMEAVWTRLFPAMDEVRRLFRPEALGPIRAVSCAFSYYLPAQAAGSRNLRPELGGGGLLDVGVYCLHLCDALFGAAPEELTGLASINTDGNRFGVDEQAMLLARYPGQALANMSCGVRTAMQDTARIYAADASVELPVFWKPTKLSITRSRGRAQVHETHLFPVPQRPGLPPDEGFHYELEHVQHCLRLGRTESPEVSWAATGRVLAACDALRAQWGLRYPFEA